MYSICERHLLSFVNVAMFVWSLSLYNIIEVKVSFFMQNHELAHLCIMNRIGNYIKEERKSWPYAGRVRNACWPGT